MYTYRIAYFTYQSFFIMNQDFLEEVIIKENAMHNNGSVSYNLFKEFQGKFLGNLSLIITIKNEQIYFRTGSFTIEMKLWWKV